MLRFVKSCKGIESADLSPARKSANTCSSIPNPFLSKRLRLVVTFMKNSENIFSNNMHRTNPAVEYGKYSYFSGQNFENWARYLTALSLSHL